MNNSKNFDLAFVDTWRDASDGAPMYKKMKSLEKCSPNTKFMYWVEGFLRSRIRAEKFYEIIDAYKDGCIADDYDAVENDLRKI